MESIGTFATPLDNVRNILSRICIRKKESVLKMNHDHRKNNHASFCTTSAPVHVKGSGCHLVWQTRKASDPNMRTVSVIAKNCPDIFSKTVGVFTLNGFDIVSAKTYRQDNSTFDTFNVRALPGHRLEDNGLVCAENDLRDILAGKLNLPIMFREKIPGFGNFLTQSNLPKPNRIVVDNKSSFLFSIIEISTYDFPGLLFRVTDALYICGLNVWKAKISTKSNRVFDVFYVKDFDGQKVSSQARILAIRAALKAVLPRTG